MNIINNGELIVVIDGKNEIVGKAEVLENGFVKLKDAIIIRREIINVDMVPEPQKSQMKANNVLFTNIDLPQRVLSDDGLIFNMRSKIFYKANAIVEKTYYSIIANFNGLHIPRGKMPKDLKGGMA